MQKCRLNGKAVYAFKVIDKNGIVDVEYEKMLRRASEQGQLKCEDCGADIIFKFGNIKIPHFAHKNDFSYGGCSYSRETEEHIQGKILLFNLMLKNYPDIEAEIRYRFSNGKQADLYFKFNDGKQLVIEFQRELNSLRYWESKREFYKSSNIKDLWIASGKRDEFENILREYEFMFQHRLFLNGNNNVLLVLDVERKELLIASKMIVIDEETNNIIKDKIFWRVYSISNIKILPDGTIDCKFNKEFNDEMDIFVQAYLEEKRRREEQDGLRKKLEERKKIIEERQEHLKKLNQNTNQANNRFEKINVFSEIGYKQKSYDHNKYNQDTKKSYNDYVRNEYYYKDKVYKAINGYKYGIENLVRILVRGGSTEYNIIKKLFEIEISKGDGKAKKVFNEVMKLSGLD